MSDTITRFTVTDNLDGQAPQATHTLHLPIRPADLHDAVTRLGALTGSDMVTGAYVGGDSWHEWCEPFDPDEDFTVLHVDVTLPYGPDFVIRHAARTVAVAVTGKAQHLITLTHDWSATR